MRGTDSLPEHALQSDWPSLLSIGVAPFHSSNSFLDSGKIWKRSLLPQFRPSLGSGRWSAIVQHPFLKAPGSCTQAQCELPKAHASHPVISQPELCC